MNFIKRMSFFTKTLLLACINIVLIGTVLLSSSYMIQKTILVDQLHDQITTVTEEFFKEIDPKLVAEAMTQKSSEGEAQAILQEKFDLIHKYNPNIAQTYIFGTEMGGENHNQTSIIAMSSNLKEAFKADNLYSGDMYEEPKAMVDGLVEMLKTKQPTFTSFYHDSFGTWTSILYPVTDDKGEVFAFFSADVDASAIPAGSIRMLGNGILIMVVFLVIIFIIQYFMTRLTLNPIRELVRGIGLVSEGNLNVRLKTGNDDLGIINQKFNIMVERINDAMVQVQHTSNAVMNSAKSLHEISEQNSESTSLIIASIQEISDGIANQEQASSDSARGMTELSTVVLTIAENSSKVAEEAYDMEQKSIEGNASVEQVIAQMEQIQQIVSESAEAILSLDNRSQEIENIVSIIRGISSQTNLLALNASIEAARVGEHGRGFAVVAGEVRKLAEQSANSVSQISEVVKEIQEEIHKAVEALERGTNEVQRGIAISDVTGQLLSGILQATQNVASEIQEISSSTEELSAGTEELTATSESLSQSVGITALYSSEISISVHEQKETGNVLLNSSTDLTTMSEELQKLLSQFQVRAKE
jgi:methyl-accepting chemotaxis protein